MITSMFLFTFIIILFHNNHYDWQGRFYCFTIHKIYNMAMLISQIDDTLKERFCLFIDHETCISILHHSYILSNNIKLQIGSNVY